MMNLDVKFTMQLEAAILITLMLNLQSSRFNEATNVTSLGIPTLNLWKVQQVQRVVSLVPEACAINFD